MRQPPPYSTSKCKMTSLVKRMKMEIFGYQQKLRPAKSRTASGSMQSDEHLMKKSRRKKIDFTEYPLQRPHLLIRLPHLTFHIRIWLSANTPTCEKPNGKWINAV